MGRLLTKLRYLPYFLRFKSYGRNIVFSKGGTIIRPSEMELGSNIFISRNFHISARDIKIGSAVMIGPNLVIESDDHIYSVPGTRMYDLRKRRILGSIRIENDVWCGANVTILKGAIIREGCVIGAGSIVTKPMPPYSICVGAPCNPIKGRFTLDNLRRHMSTIDSAYSPEQVLVFWKQYNLT